MHLTDFLMRSVNPFVMSERAAVDAVMTGRPTVPRSPSARRGVRRRAQGLLRARSTCCSRSSAKSRSTSTTSRSRASPSSSCCASARSGSTTPPTTSRWRRACCASRRRCSCRARRRRGVGGSAGRARAPAARVPADARGRGRARAPRRGAAQSVRARLRAAPTRRRRRRRWPSRSAELLAAVDRVLRAAREPAHARRRLARRSTWTARSRSFAPCSRIARTHPLARDREARRRAVVGALDAPRPARTRASGELRLHQPKPFANVEIRA